MLIRHSVIYVTSNVVTGAFSLFTTMALTRLLTPADYGVYGLGFAVIGLIGSIFFEWHAMSFLRFGQNHGDRQEVLVTFIFLFGALTGLSGGIFALFCATDLAPAYDLILLVGLIGAWATAWFQFALRVRMADLQPERAFWMNLARVLITLAASLAAAYLTKDAIYVLLATALGQLAGACIYPLRGFSLAYAKFSRPLVQTVVAFGYPVAISMTLAGISVAINRFMLDQLASTEAVGRFTAANFAVQSVLSLLCTSIGQATYPLSVRAIELHDPAGLERQLTDNFTLLLAVSLPAAIGLTLIAPNLVPLLVGRDFVDAVVVLTPWMAAAAVLGGIRAQYFDYAFQFAQKTGYLVFILATTVTLNIGLNILLIPRYGEVGSAMALVCALGPALALALVLSPRAFAMPAPLKVVAKVVFASLVMSGAVMALSPVHGLLGLILEMSVGAAVYATALLAVDLMGFRGRALKSMRQAGRIAINLCDFSRIAK